MKSLFRGVIEEDLAFPFPEPGSREVETLHGLLDSIRRFGAKRVDSARIDREAHIPEEVFDGLKKMGLFGVTIPREFGGAGLSHTAHARIIQEVAAIDASIAITLGAHESLGARGLLLHGTDDQKRRYLPRLATGEMVGAFSLTEPGAGSDAANIQTHAERVPGGYRLRGSKIWTTNGGIADLFTVLARTSPRGEEGVKPKLTSFLVERGPGLTTGPNAPKLGIRGSSTTAVYLDDVIVPDANVLGERGRGFKVALETINAGRLTLASGCIGLSKNLIRLSVERAKERHAFGRVIAEFGMIKDKIARMMADTYALESMVYLTTGRMDDVGERFDFSIESAICKVFGSEALFRTVNEALQLAAGVGYMQDYPYERHLRDSRINLIFDGTNEILRCYIALAGMQQPGKEISDVAKAIRQPVRGFELWSDFAVRKARSALGRERLGRVADTLAPQAQVFETYTRALSNAVAKAVVKHERALGEMQFLQARVAEIAIDLYAVAAVLSRTTQAIERRGTAGARREIDLLTMFVNGAQRRLARAFEDIERNDDELRKEIAARACSDGGYPCDVF